MKGETMKTNLEDSVARINAGWHKLRPGGRDERKGCRYCKHCGTSREVGVFCKHPHSAFFETEIDAVCKRFDPRYGLGLK